MRKNTGFGVMPWGSVGSWEISPPLSFPYNYQRSSFDKLGVSVKVGVGGKSNDALQIILVTQP